MAATGSSTLNITLPSEREIQMTRVFNAPRELVFKAHSSCEHMSRWWGPRRYELSVCEMDFRPGGAYRFVHRAEDGGEHGFRGEFREIVRPERIVWTFEYEGMPGHISFQTLTLTEENGRTTLTATALFDSVEDRDGMLQSGMEEGASESYERLAEYVAELAQAPEEQALVITRVFDAPRELLWKAWSERERVMRWWGPEGFTSPACEIDFRVGGKYLFAMQSPDFNEGESIWSTGVYREIVPLERIVCTDCFADAEGNVVPASHYGMSGDFPQEMLVTVTFQDLGGKTRMTLRHEGLPRQHREDAGAGWGTSLDKLARFLAEA